MSHYRQKARPPAVVALDARTDELLLAFASGGSIKTMAPRFGTSRITLQNWISWYEAEHGQVPRRGRGRPSDEQRAQYETEAEAATPVYGKCPTCHLRQYTREDAIRARIDGRCSACPTMTVDDFANARRVA